MKALPGGNGAPGPPLARWCEQHTRWECTKNRKRGGHCHASALKGLDACRLHCGKKVSQARKDALTAWAAVPGDDGITPRAAVSAHLNLAWRRAQEYGRLLQQQVEGSAPAEAAGGDDEDGAPAGTSGLVGHTWSSSSEGLYATGEKARALVELERAERELLLKFAAEGHRMGIEERAQWVAERDAAGIAAVIRGTLAKLNLDPESPEVGAAVAATIRELSGAPRAALPG